MFTNCLSQLLLVKTYLQTILPNSSESCTCLFKVILEINWIPSINIGDKISNVYTVDTQWNEQTNEAMLSQESYSSLCVIVTLIRFYSHSVCSRLWKVTAYLNKKVKRKVLKSLLGKFFVEDFIHISKKQTKIKRVYLKKRNWRAMIYRFQYIKKDWFNRKTLLISL